MTDYKDLLLIPDIMLDKDKFLNKREARIAPYWNHVEFNKEIHSLKKYSDNINPLYLREFDFRGLLKRLNGLED